MGGITVDDFTSSVAYREIFGLGRQTEAVALTLRLLEHRCGALTPQPTSPHPGPHPHCAGNPLHCTARLPGARGPQRLADPPRQLSPSRFNGRTVPEPCARGCKAHKASCPPISPSPAPPVVLQRMSLPADRPPRLPTRGNFHPPHRAAPRAPNSHGAPPAGRSRFSRHPAGPAARGLPSLRPAGGHPADHPPLLPAAGLRVAGLGGISLIRLAGAWKC